MRKLRSDCSECAEELERREGFWCVACWLKEEGCSF